MWKQYLFLTKPGILFGNLVTTLGGLFLAAPSFQDLPVFMITLLGTLLVVASGCVFNNIIDQDIDQNMQRTKTRALVRKTITVPQAFVFGTVLGVAGFAMLLVLVNTLAFACALLGFIVYVGIYSLWFKRYSIHQTVIGSISGACPPLIGYCALRGQIDVAALVIFTGYALWQMPHSWGIAIYRLDDYRQAGIPILPVARSVRRTKTESLIYVVLFTIVMNLLYVWGYTNSIYAILLNVMCGYWLYLSIAGFSAVDDQLWAKKYFMFSVKLITLISLALALTTVDPPPAGYVLWQVR